MKLHIYRSRYKQDYYSYEQEDPIKLCLDQGCVVTVSRKPFCQKEGELDVKFKAPVKEQVCCSNC